MDGSATDDKGGADEVVEAAGPVPGRLTTHVLDTALGRPAAGLGVELWRIEDAERTLIGRGTTNADGRFERPILEGEAFQPGHYELVFAAGDYLKGRHADLPDPLFLDLVPIRFGIAEAEGHYHVPLLLSPFGYSTYRGS